MKERVEARVAREEAKLEKEDTDESLVSDSVDEVGPFEPVQGELGFMFHRVTEHVWLWEDTTVEQSKTQHIRGTIQDYESQGSTRP